MFIRALLCDFEARIDASYRGSNQLVGSLIISLFEDTIRRI